ncbi:MAG TPA: transglycosylase family protein [Acidimicrobiales bacterium]|nr:transglycosylase family protein [Acidimicrobiales bacterium]
MRTHPLLALFTTTLTLITSGAAAGAFADQGAGAAGFAPHTAGRAATRLLAAHALDARAAAERRAGVTAVATHALRLFVRSDVSAAGPLGLALVLGSRGSDRMLSASVRHHAAHLVQALLDGARRPGASATSPATGIWLALRTCESGGNYRADTGNGYFGAYQFLPTTWWSLGYSGLPSSAPVRVQDQAARVLEARSGWGPWPQCAAVLRLGGR